MKNPDRMYNKFSENKAYDVLARNPEYVQAKEKTTRVAKELEKMLDKVSSLIKEYNDCITNTAAIAYREYYKQGYKFNRK